MKIAVLIKCVLDFGLDLQINQKEMTVVQRDRPPIWIVNPADRSALETGLSIKKEMRDTEVLVLNFGQAEGCNALYYALARGADRGVFIEDKTNTYRDIGFIAAAIARFLSQEKVDLVLCGGGSIDSNMNCMGPFVAEFLNFPQITSVIELHVSVDPPKAIAQRRLEKGNRELIECSLPVVIEVDPKISRPRYVSIYALNQARKMKLERVSLKSLGVENEGKIKTKIIRIEPPKPRSKRKPIPDSRLSAAERIKLMKKGGITKKKEKKILRDDPESLAEGIIRFLQEKGFII